MIRYILKRLVLSITTFIGVSIIVFYIIHIIPGDPITLMYGKNPNKEAIEMLKKQYFLDKPIYVQYFLWFKNAARLNFGKSLLTQIPVITLVSERIGRSILLAGIAIVIATIFAIPIGIISANKRNTNLDLGISSMSLFMLSVPEFWTGLLLVMFFSVKLKILPSGGYVFPDEDFFGFLKSIILPVLSITIMQTAIITRMIRTSMIDALEQDYITLARASGINRKRILYIHGFRNALLPVVTVIGLTFGYALGGEVVVEKIFRYPGLGLLMFDSISSRDYPVIQATILVFSFLFISVNLLVDVVYAFINPRIKHG
jgi:peptide/nickel transport system permease protein